MISLFAEGREDLIDALTKIGVKGVLSKGLQ
jgi:hypothetical protein